MKDTKTILGVIVGIILLIIAGYYIYADISNLNSESVSNNVEIKDEKKEDAIIKEIPITNTSVPIPNLDSQVIYSTTLSEEALPVVKIRITEARNLLKENPKVLRNWIELGGLYKIAGDFDKAIEAWNYAGIISPGNSVSFQNLGDLYGYYLKDPIKGEENLLKAISNSPNDVYLYFKMADFYKDVMKNEIKRRNIVEQGIEANPSVQELKDLLQSL